MSLFPSYSFIVNHVAGRGASLRAMAKVVPFLEKHGISFDIHRTDGPGDATRMACDAPGACVVAVGGDGTINETGNGVVGSQKALAVIPAGSGNDFIKSVGIPRNAMQAAELLVSGMVRMVDAGVVRTGRLGNPGLEMSPDRFFMNGVGVGLDAAVAVQIRQIPRLRGTLLYLAAVLQTIPKFKAPRFRAIMDGNEWSGQQLLVSIGNGPCAGGGFYLTPNAKVDDGVLDIMTVGKLPVGRILRLIPEVLRGTHSERHGARFMRASTIRLESEDYFHVHADGEIVGSDVNVVEVGIRPGAIRVVVPVRPG